jgi:hypothetical protein
MKGIGIDIQERDLAVMRGLYEARVMTLAHLADLYFDGSFHAATKRVQKLKQAGLLSARPRLASAPSVLFLSSSGFDEVIAAGLPEEYPLLSRPQMERRARVSEQTIRHELRVMDVKAAVVAAARKRSELSVQHFCTWPRLNAFSAVDPRGTLLPIEPDGFLILHADEGGGTITPYRFFVEVDRSTEAQNRLADHAHCYRDYYYSGGFALRCGGTREEIEDYPFRVLFVFQTPERRNNAAEKMLLLRKPIGSHSCLTTFAELLADPFGEIWITPHGYHQVTASTSYDPQRRKDQRGYSRSTERERFVEERIQKHSLLE